MKSTLLFENKAWNYNYKSKQWKSHIHPKKEKLDDRDRYTHSEQINRKWVEYLRGIYKQTTTERVHKMDVGNE